MKITLTLNDNLYQKAKEISTQTHTTLSAVIEDAMREYITRRGRCLVKGVRPKLPVFDGKGLQPGIDLDHSGVLLDLDNSRY